MACRLNRLIRIIQIVHGKSFPNVQDLCRRFQIKERTLFNDLKELKEDLGVNIQFDRNRRGYFLASDAAEISLLTLNRESALLLLAALGVWSCFAGEQLAAPLYSLFNDEIDIGLDFGLNAREIIRVDIARSQIDREMFFELSRACLKSETVRLQDNLSNSREILPKRLILTSDEWLLQFSLDDRDSDTQTLPLAAIKNVERKN